MIQLRRNASGRLDCQFSDSEMFGPVLSYVSDELGFKADKPIHDPALIQLYVDCKKAGDQLIFGYDEWFEGFFVFAWNAESDAYIQKIYDRFHEIDKE